MRRWNPLTAAGIGAAAALALLAADIALGGSFAAQVPALRSPVAATLGGALWGAVVAWVRNMLVRPR